MDLRLRRVIGAVILATILGISPFWAPIPLSCIASAVITALIAIAAFVVLSRKESLGKKTKNSLMKPDFIPFLIAMMGNMFYFQPTLDQAGKLPFLQGIAFEFVLLMQWLCLFLLVVLAGFFVSEIRQRRHLS